MLFGSHRMLCAAPKTDRSFFFLQVFLLSWVLKHCEPTGWSCVIRWRATVPAHTKILPPWRKRAHWLFIFFWLFIDEKNKFFFLKKKQKTDTTTIGRQNQTPLVVIRSNSPCFRLGSSAKSLTSILIVDPIDERSWKILLLFNFMQNVKRR